MTWVHNRPDRADATAVVGKVCSFRVMPATGVFRASDSSEATYTAYATTDANGRWVIDLPPNETGSWYEVTQPGADTLLFAVPTAAATVAVPNSSPVILGYWVRDILTVAPAQNPPVVIITGGGGGAVSSVFTRTGAVVAQSGDYTAAQVGAAATVHTHAEADTTNLVTDLAGKAATSHTHTEANVTSLVTDLAAKAADSAVVHLTGAETVAGIKTFSSAPVVPTASFPEAAVTNLTTDLAAKAAKLTPTAKTAAYTAVDGDFVIGDATTAGFTVTLPASTAARLVAVRKVDASVNAVTVATTSGTIDGAATRTLGVQWQTQIYIADGTNWQRLDVPGVTAIAATGTPSATTFLRGDGSWNTPAGGAAGPGYTGLRRSTGYYPLMAVYNAAAVPTLNQENCFAFVISNSCTADRISVYLSVIGAAGAVARVGVRNDNGSGSPGTLLLDAGTVVADSGVGLKEITISQAFTAGLYWASVTAQVATTASFALGQANNNIPGIVLGWTTSVATNAQTPSTAYQSSVTGALGTFTLAGVNGTSSCPNVWMRFV